MGEVIDFTEKFKQKPKPKDPEPDAEASTKVGDELLPAGQDEFSQAEPGITDEQAENAPTGAAPEEKTCAEPGSNKHVDLLIFSASQEADFFHTLERVPFTTIHYEDRYETWPVRSSDFKMWM